MNNNAAVDAYLAAQPAQSRALLERVRAIAREACPDAVEVIAYGMPALRLHGRLLLSYAGYKRHCAIYPASGAAQAALGAELAPFVTEKATIRFTPATPLPDDVLRRYVAARVRELEAAAEATS